ncbi:MAG: AMIN domain-containing protein [Desulfobacteraceae bacterium]|nr:AMIN domain-containing protein [Desulfobacteraceae bacterium]
MNILRFKPVASLILATSIILACGGRGQAASDKPYQATAILFCKEAAGFSATIKGNTTPTFTTYQLFDPMRVVVDIANASFADSLHLPLEVKQSPLAKITGSMLTDKNPVIAKLEFQLDTDSQYTVKRNGNDINIIFTPGVQKENQPEDDTAAHHHKNADGKPEIYDLRVTKETGAAKFLLVADGPIQDFKKVTLPKVGIRPDRMYIDIPGFRAPALDREIKVGAGGVARVRVADRTEGARIIFDSSSGAPFTSAAAPAPEGILITTKAKGAALPQAKGGPDPVSQALALYGQPESAKDKQGESTAQKKAKDDAAAEFADSGFDRQKITVDFYKTDLHNVFRLIGEVGGYNIVVDDSVKGVLTLSLREVPWDFLLDVIMNLKGLQKIERYNTIVISAKDKGFSWPEKVTPKKELEIEPPKGQAALAVEKKLSQPPMQLAANLIIQKGDSLAREGKFKEALAQYQMALDKWPNNAELAKRMAGMCLSDLGYNQEATDYAKKALALNPKDPEAALQAAIGLANMHRPEARHYFETAVNVPHPSRAALLSFAGYEEDNADFEGALATLAKYTSLYNASLDTMVARARIFDKQKKPELAVAEYKAILYSGYDLAPDLAKYIKGRVKLADQQ